MRARHWPWGIAWHREIFKWGYAIWLGALCLQRQNACNQLFVPHWSSGDVRQLEQPWSAGPMTTTPALLSSPTIFSLPTWFSVTIFCAAHFFLFLSPHYFMLTIEFQSQIFCVVPPFFSGPAIFSVPLLTSVPPYFSVPPFSSVPPLFCSLKFQFTHHYNVSH